MCYLKQEEGQVVFHSRAKEGDKIKAKGGMTVVYDGKHRLFGVSKCSPADNFNKRMGISIAIGRLKKQVIRRKAVRHVFTVGDLSETPSYEEIREAAAKVEAFESC